MRSWRPARACSRTAAGDGAVWVVGHHLEGDFPGGTADLDYRFALDGDRIQRLDIVVGGGTAPTA